MALVLVSLLAIAGAALLFVGSVNIGSALTKRKKRRPSRGPNRKALLIGIRYENAHSLVPPDVSLDLDVAPHREVETWRGILTNHFTYEDSDITCMLDQDGQTAELWPCHQHILDQLKALVEDVRPGDRRFLFVAGHGGELPYENTLTESNGNVGVFYSVECGGTRLERITQNELRSILVDNIPEGATLTVVFELCHSGSLLNLPFRLDSAEDESPMISRTNSPADHVEGDILCLSACESWQEAYQYEIGETEARSIITSVVQHTLPENDHSESAPRLKLVELHRVLLQAASRQGQSGDMQTPVVTIGKQIPTEDLERRCFHP